MTNHDTNTNADEDDQHKPPGRSREYYRQQDPNWLTDVGADRVVNYYTLSYTRHELLLEIADRVGFEVEEDRDRLTKEQLAQILVWMRAVEGTV
ncbi:MULTISPECIES: hypothetical protein [Halobacterium]|uniref:hypothetical protein n=1 Tax=Halobacterium TaxID=2239 RepID=UPI00073F33FD|nr:MULTISPECIES: hypothetical protein [Halobacterium]MCG1002839.1 hypothetical protein [Halobacterium noricense]